MRCVVEALVVVDGDSAAEGVVDVTATSTTVVWTSDVNVIRGKVGVADVSDCTCSVVGSYCLSSDWLDWKSVHGR